MPKTPSTSPKPKASGSGSGSKSPSPAPSPANKASGSGSGSKSPSPVLSPANKEKANLEKFAAVEARIKALERQDKEASAIAQGVLLFDEYKKHYKTVKGQSFVKTCAGASICTNVLCDHTTVVGNIGATLPKVDESALDHFLVRCARGGYPVRRNFAGAILAEKKNMIIPAFEQLKAEIDVREAKLHMTGRVSVPYERIAAYRHSEMQKCRGDQDIPERTRDSVLEELELEESALASNRPDAWKMIFGIKKAKNTKDQAEGENYAEELHKGEKNYRNARSIAWMEINGCTKDQWAIEKFMESWENRNCNPGDLGRDSGGFGSSYRRSFWCDPNTDGTLERKRAADRDAVEGANGVEKEDLIWEMQHRIPLFPLSHIIDPEALAKQYYYPANEAEDTNVGKGQGQEIESGEASGSLSTTFQATAKENVGVEPALPLEYLQLRRKSTSTEVPSASTIKTPDQTYHTENEIGIQGRNIPIVVSSGEHVSIHGRNIPVCVSSGHHVSIQGEKIPIVVPSGNHVSIQGRNIPIVVSSEEHVSVQGRNIPIVVPSPLGDHASAYLSATRNKYWKFEDTPIEIDEAKHQNFNEPIEVDDDTFRRVQNQITAAKARQAASFQNASTAGIKDHPREDQETVKVEGLSNPAIESQPTDVQPPKTGKSKKKKSNAKRQVANSEVPKAEASTSHSNVQEQFPIIDHADMSKLPAGTYVVKVTAQGCKIVCGAPPAEVSTRFTQTMLSICPSGERRIYMRNESQSGLDEPRSESYGQGGGDGSGTTSQVVNDDPAPHTASDVKGKGRAIDEVSTPQTTFDVKGKAVDEDSTPQIALNDKPLDASKHEISHILEKFKNPAAYRESEALLDETSEEEEDEEESDENISLPPYERDFMYQALDSWILETYKYKLGTDATEEKIQFVMSWGCSVYELANTLIILCVGSEAIAASVYSQFCLPLVKKAFARLQIAKPYDVPELVQMMYDAEILGWANHILDTIQKHNNASESQAEASGSGSGSASSTQPPNKTVKRQNAKSKQLAFLRARKR